MKLINDFKDKIVLASWIIGLLLIIAVFWGLTQTVQTKYLLRTINNVLINNNDPRRVAAFIPQKNKNASLMGYKYSFYNSSDSLFVFTVFQNGILIPLGAVISSDNSVKEVIPLSEHAKQGFENIPQSVLQLYIRRIETEGVR